MSPPTIDKFLEGIAQILRDKDGVKLQQYLRYEPPFVAVYEQMRSEIRQVYGPGSQDALEKKCTSFIPEYDEGVDGGSRASFITFLVKYFVFLRDLDVGNLVETHDQLKALLK